MSLLLLPISTPTNKDLGSHHSHPYIKEIAKQTKNQLLLNSSENWGHMVHHHLSFQRGSEWGESQSRTYMGYKPLEPKQIGEISGNFDNLLESECGPH